REAACLSEMQKSKLGQGKDSKGRRQASCPDGFLRARQDPPPKRHDGLRCKRGRFVVKNRLVAKPNLRMERDETNQSGLTLLCFRLKRSRPRAFARGRLRFSTCGARSTTNVALRPVLTAAAGT